MPGGGAVHSITSGRQTLFDQLVGAKKDLWADRDAERFRSFHIDHQFKLGRLLDRELGRLGALQYLVYENSGTSVHFVFGAEIGRKSTIARKLSPGANGGYPVAERQLRGSFGR